MWLVQAELKEAEKERGKKKETERKKYREAGRETRGPTTSWVLGLVRVLLGGIGPILGLGPR